VTEASSNQPRYDYREDDGLDLGTYLRAVWRRRTPVLIVAVACAMAAGTCSVRAPLLYEARVALAVSRSALNEGGRLVVIQGTFQSYIENESVAEQVIDEFSLDELYGLTPGRFFRTSAGVEALAGSTLFRLRTRFPEPELAANVANRVAELAVKKADQLSQDEAVQVREAIGEQLHEATARLEHAEEALQTYRTEAQIELLRRDVDSALEARGQLLTLLVQIESERSKLTTAEAELASRERIGTVTRSIGSNATVVELARSATDQPPALVGLQVQDEIVSRVYEVVDEEVATSRAALAALEQQRSQLIDVRKLDRDKLADLSRLYQAESRLTRLQMEQELAQQVYRQVSIRHETARLDVAGRNAQLHVIDPALVPLRPMARNVPRNTILGLMLGFMISVGGVLFFSVIGAIVSTKEGGAA